MKTRNRPPGGESFPRRQSLKTFLSCFAAIVGTSLFPAFSLASEPLESSDYFPLQVGNFWEYAGGIGGGVTETMTITHTDIIGAATYFVFSNYILGERKFREDSASQVIEYLDGTGQETVLYKFAASEGESWSIQDWYGCEVSLVSRNETVSVPAGTFTECIRLEFQCPNVFDAGYITQWFAPNVGLIKRIDLTIVGETTYELTHALVNGRYYGPEFDYFPLQVGNSWEYVEGIGGGATEAITITDTEIIGAATYFVFSNYILGERKFREDSASQVIEYLDGTGQETVLYKFAASEGESWSIQDWYGCGVTLVRRNETVSVPAGTFTECIRLEFQCPNIFDAGYITQWFAPNVGLIKRIDLTIVGETTYELTHALVNGRYYGPEAESFQYFLCR